MFGFEKSGIQERLISVVGALFFSTLFVGAAVGPVRAAEFAPVAYAQAEAPVQAVANV